MKLFKLTFGLNLIDDIFQIQKIKQQKNETD